MATGSPQQPVKRLLGLVPRDLCDKYKVEMVSNNNVTDVYSCCHGNIVSLAATHGIDWYFHKGHVYQT